MWLSFLVLPEGRHRTKLKHAISNKVEKSFVQNRPLLTTKNDFGNHELQGISIHKEDKPRIKLVKRKNPRFSKKYRDYLERKRNK